MENGTDTLRLPAKVEELDRALGFLGERLEGAGCPLKVRMKIEMAVEEIFVNVAQYAYGGGEGEAEVAVRVEGDPPAAVIEIRDRGTPFDPLAKPDPDVTLNADERGIGGLGVFMVKKAMDDVRYRYEDGMNILTMRRRLAE